MNNILLITLFFCLFVHPVLAQETNSNDTKTITDTNINPEIKELKLQNVLPGEIFYLKIAEFEDEEYWPKLGQTRAILIRGKGSDEIYAGVDIKTNPGEYLLAIETSKKQLATYKFIVPTPVKPVFIENSPSFFNDAPLANTQELSDTLLWSNFPPKFPLVLPVKGDWSNSIGHFYEKRLNSSNTQNNEIDIVDHIAIEIASPTQVQAPGDAVCFSISFDPIQGYSVILDHGMGLFSEITGLNNLTISEQDKVKQGAIIASFNTANFLDKDSKPKDRTVRWRTFLNKSIINPYQLTKLQ